MNNIVISVSENWFEYLNIQLYSIVKKQKCKTYKFHILTSEPKNEKALKTLNMMEYLNMEYKVDNTVYFYDLDRLFSEKVTSDINITERFTKFTLFRLFIPVLINAEKALYLDSDILVVSDISELFELNVDDSFWCGCVDIGIMPTHKQDIGMLEVLPYFNAGVGFLNLKLIKEHKLYDYWIKLANEKQLLGLDQDIWNITMSERCVILDNSYNSSISTGFSANPKIVHFAGNKPWNDSSVPYYDIWERYKNEYESICRN